VEYTLPVIAMFHVDIIKLLNLITRFLTSCDYMGEFDINAKFPNEYMMVEIEENNMIIGDCIKNRNKKAWFNYCKDICEKFNIASFSKFYEPNLEDLIKFNVFANSKL
jgi:hypothetical protein